jgi:D-alanyl-D-alanine carboxypeptidase/D-alanyl-D-alanine-endopeptidase (penicillin-binding protein 4)
VALGVAGALGGCTSTAPVAHDTTATAGTAAPTAPTSAAPATAVPGSATLDPTSPTTAAPTPTIAVPTAACPPAQPGGSTAPAPVADGALGIGRLPAPAASTTTSTTSSTRPAPSASAPPGGPGTAAVQQALASLVASAGRVSVSVDGPRADGTWGTILASHPDEALTPASNQKVLVAAAVLASLPPDDVLHTQVVATGPVRDGVVQGDLVLVGGGDPTLAGAGAAGDPDSLADLARQVRAAGITGATGAVTVDDSRYDRQRGAPGWPIDAYQSGFGPLSALEVDRNRVHLDAASVADPALAAGRDLAGALTAAGVSVPGPVHHADTTASGTGAAATAGTVVAQSSSPPLRDLVATMVNRSDILVAEVLVKELGLRLEGTGSTAVGLDAVHRALSGLCLDLGGNDSDGSGLSYTDMHSSAALRHLLEVATTTPWWPSLRAMLPDAGTSGTLVARLTGPTTRGRVLAKTGSLLVARSLSGYLATTDGRTEVFSILTADPTAGTEHAIDALVTALAEAPPSSTAG